MTTVIYGVGIREQGKYATSENNKHTKVYTLWKNMLARCYSKTMLSHRPTYEHCEVSGDFVYFQRFAEWYEQQTSYEGIEYQLDKDLLVKGNKIYSEAFCLMIPRQVNMFLCKSEAARGSLPIGVTFDKRSGLYMAQLSDRGYRYSSQHRTPEEAHATYKREKEAVAKRLANDYEGLCDDRVILALRQYQVEITD